LSTKKKKGGEVSHDFFYRMFNRIDSPLISAILCSHAGK
jgi:hypothetical protein